MRLSLRRRLLVATTALTLLVVGLVAVLVHGAMTHALRRDLDQALHTEALALAARLEVYQGRLAFEVEPGSSPAPPGVELQVFNADGSGVFSTPALARCQTFSIWLKDHLEETTAQWFDETLTELTGPQRVIALPASAQADESEGEPAATAHGWVFAIRSLVPLGHTLAQLRWTLAAGVVLAGLAALVSGYLVARSATRPILTVADRIARVEPGRLERESATAEIPMELDPIVDKIDELLLRIEDELARQRRLTADVAHDLRTPLAGIRTLFDVTLRRERSGGEYRDCIATAQAALRSLSALLDHVLTLARLDAQVEVARVAPVDLASVIDSAVDIVQPSARSKDVTIEVAGANGHVLETDAHKLTTILVNLLANAVEYGPRSARVTVSVTHAEDRVTIQVHDEGPGIPLEHRDRIFDRFVRGDVRRAGGSGHHGLGLPIARGFARVLGGDLHLANGNGSGSEFVLDLPVPQS